MLPYGIGFMQQTMRLDCPALVSIFLMDFSAAVII